jgi:quinoprotein glucose dehydrogenase
MIAMASQRAPRTRPPRIFASILMLIGLALLGGGSWLAILGGSVYYALAGVDILAAGVLLWRGQWVGVLIYWTMLIGTVVWALWEVGLDGWQLLPRLWLFTVLGLWMLTPWVRRGLD